MSSQANVVRRYAYLSLSILMSCHTYRTWITSASAAQRVIDFPVVFLDKGNMSTELASLIPIMKCVSLFLLFLPFASVYISFASHDHVYVRLFRPPIPRSVLLLDFWRLKLNSIRPSSLPRSDTMLRSWFFGKRKRILTPFLSVIL